VDVELEINVDFGDAHATVADLELRHVLDVEPDVDRLLSTILHNPWQQVVKHVAVDPIVVVCGVDPPRHVVTLLQGVEHAVNAVGTHPRLQGLIQSLLFKGHGGWWLLWLGQAHEVFEEESMGSEAEPGFVDEHGFWSLEVKGPPLDFWQFELHI